MQLDLLKAWDFHKGVPEGTIGRSLSPQSVKTLRYR